jgi:RHS repeat-associated protein
MLITYQWERNISGSWSTIPGATGSSYALPYRQGGDGVTEKYRRVAISNGLRAFSNEVSVRYSLFPTLVPQNVPKHITVPAEGGKYSFYIDIEFYNDGCFDICFDDGEYVIPLYEYDYEIVSWGLRITIPPNNGSTVKYESINIEEVHSGQLIVIDYEQPPMPSYSITISGDQTVCYGAALKPIVSLHDVSCSNGWDVKYSWKARDGYGYTYAVPRAYSESCTPENLQWPYDETVEYYRIAECDEYKEYSNAVSVYYAPPPTLISATDTIRAVGDGGWYEWPLEMRVDSQYGCTPLLKDFGAVVAVGISKSIEYRLDNTLGQVLLPPNYEGSSRTFKLSLRNKLRGEDMSSVVVMQEASPLSPGSIAALRDTVRIGEPTCLQNVQAARCNGSSLTYRWEQKLGESWVTIQGATDADYIDVYKPSSNATIGYRRVATCGSKELISDELKVTYVGQPTVDELWDGSDKLGDDYAQQDMASPFSGVADVNAIGAATYTIPIECPTGIQGMQPNIALAYNSQARNGIAGWGWNIAGVSAITRTGSTIYHDGKVAGVKMTDEDNLMLDGQRLMSSSNRFTNGAKYRTEIETFSDITCKTINGYLCFEVATKDGKTLQYGASSDSRVGSGATFTWLLTRMEDANGNYMTYTYGEDVTNNEYWLSKIAYTGNNAAGVAPVNEISFEYEDRQDVEAHYIAGTKTGLSKRLSTITVKSSSQIFRKYKLEYAFDGLYSKLINVKESTANGATYTPLKFTWGSGYSKSEYEYGMLFQPELAAEAPPLFADFNGDGRQDFITINNRIVKLYLNEGGVYDTEPKRTFQVNISGSYVDALVADLNGDGLPDLVYVTQSNSAFNYNFVIWNGKEFDYSGIGFHDIAHSSEYIEVDINNDGKFEQRLRYNSSRSIVGDFNGDGKHEVLIKGSQKVYDQHGSKIAEGGITWGDDWRPELPNNLNLLDFTGNGKTNVCTRNGSNGSIYELDVPAGIFRKVLTTNDLTNGYDVYPGDYNGDGLMDLHVITNPEGHAVLDNYFLLSTGNSFVRKDLPNLNISNNTLKGFTGDFNLDGKTDFMTAGIYENSDYYDYLIGSYIGKSIYCWRYTTYINKGSYFEPQEAVETNANVSPYYNDWNYMNIADYDGDGRSEVNFHRFGKIFWINSFDDSFSPQITAISNGLNENITLSYLPIANATEVYTSSGNASVSFPVVSVVPPLYAVRSIKNNSYLTEYSYKDILIHRQGKGFLGFGEVNITSNGIKTGTEYNYNPTYYNIFPVKKTVGMRHYPDRVISTTIYENKMKSFGGIRVYPYISKQATEDHLSNLSAATEILSIDDYGNPTLTRTISGNIAETTTATYSSNGSWCPGKPGSVTTTRQQGVEPPYARTTLYEYDTKGNLTKETKDPQDVNRVTTEYKDFDALGRAQRVETTANDSTLSSIASYTPSKRFVASKGNALGEVTSYRWDEARGLLLSETDPTGLTTSYKYDAFGRLSETTYPDKTKKFQKLGLATRTPELPREVRYYTYTKTSDGARAYVWLDNLGREICSQTYGLNGEKIFVYTEYNASTGLKTRVSKPMLESAAIAWQANFSSNKEAAEIYTYDDYHRPTKIATPRGDISYTYNGRSTIITSPEGTRETVLDGAGQVAVSKVNSQAVSYSYYASGLTKSVTPEGGQATTMKYDLQGNRTELADPNAGTITSAYNGFGQLLRQTDARGKTDVLSYDKLGRVVKKEAPEASYTYTYGKHGLESVRRNNALEYSYGYDALGRMAVESTVVGADAYTFTYKYNTLGQVQEKAYPNKFTLSYGYTAGRLKALSSGSNNLWQLMSENVYGQPLQYGWGSGQQTSLTYDTHNQLQAKNTSAQLANQQYQFNPATGNLSSRSAGAAPESFTYDALHRLTGWSGGGATYAANGNISTKTDVGTYTYSSQRPHAIAGIANPTATLDATMQQEQNIGYDSKNRPTYIAQGADSLTFYYDHTGQRLYTKHYKSGALHKTTHYVGSYEKEIYANSTQRTRCFVQAPTGLQAVYETDKGVNTLLYVHTDHLGSIVALADANGSKLAEYSYDPWGRLRHPQTLQPYAFGAAPALRLGRGFTGHEHLPEFGLINMNARLYDPLLGRFLSTDPYVVNPDYAQDYNRYMYARNNPLVYTDPSGENPLLIIGMALLGAYVGGSVANESFDPTTWDYKSADTWIGMVLGGALGAAGGAWLGTGTVNLTLSLGSPYASVAITIPGEVLAGIGTAGAAGGYGVTGASGIALVWKTIAGGGGEKPLGGKQENKQQSSSKPNYNEQYATAMEGLKDKPYVWNANGPNSFDCSGSACYGIRQAANPKFGDYSAHELYSNFFIPSTTKNRGGVIFYDYESDGRMEHITTILSTQKMLHPSSGAGMLQIVPINHLNSYTTKRNGTMYYGEWDWLLIRK